MKKSTRLFMGILFPFILIITVTSISKALKQKKNSINVESTQPENAKISAPDSQRIPVSFATHIQK